jgi:hypothetical protein
VFKPSGPCGSAAGPLLHLRLRSWDEPQAVLGQSNHDSGVAIGHLVDDDLGRCSEDLRDLRRRQAVVLFEPLGHPGGGVLQGTLERAVEADGHDVCGRLDAWRGDAFVRDQVDREFDVHGGFESVAVQFAVPLQGMTIAHVEQGAGLANLQVDRGALDDAVEIHVATEVSRVARARPGGREAG